MNIPYWIKQEKKKEPITLPYWLNNNGKSNNNNGGKSNNNNGKFDIVKDTINRISSFCFPPDLADKIISSQFKQFRTQRTDINELIVKDIKLCSLSSAEIEKYLDAIKYIWIEDEEKLTRLELISKINAIDINTFKINIDLVGFSLELSNLLGIDYLKGNYVITSVKQKDCDILRNYTSFDYQLRNIFNNYDLDQILLGESLIGSFKSDIRSILKNPESIFDIEINFDTPTCAISTLKKIKECEKRLLSDTNLIKNKTFLDALYTDIEKIIAKHGAIDRLNIEEIKYKNRLESFKFTFRSDKKDKKDEKANENIYLYCLKSTIPIFIYFSDGNDFGNINSDIRRDDFTLLNGSQEKVINILKVLISEGIVGFNPYLGLERATNMIVRKRKEILHGLLDQNPESSEEVRKMFLENLSEDIPEKAKQLLLAVRKVKDGDEISEIGNIAIYLIYPLIQNDLLYELLSRIENLEIKSTYINTEKFIDKVLKMDDNELKIYLRSLLESIEFKEEYNVVANTWLKEHKKEICAYIGVKFKYANS